MELEFKERVRGLACRRGWLVVVLRRRAVVFRVVSGEPEGVVRYQEYVTGDNTRGESFPSRSHVYITDSGRSVL